jgi:hypothetical protein
MVFVASFTENGNLLSQWRGYCPHGKGVSVGFEPNSLVAAAENASFRVGKCIYDYSSQREAASLFVDFSIAQAREEGPSKAPPTQSFYGSFLEIEPDLLRLAALMKNGSFHEEREWRMVSPVLSNYVEPPIRYREGIATLVPYLELPLPVARVGEREVIALHDVIVGPTPNANMSITAISRYLSREGIRPIRVANSGVPYRQA